MNVATPLKSPVKLNPFIKIKHMDLQKKFKPIQSNKLNPTSIFGFLSKQNQLWTPNEEPLDPFNMDLF